MSGGSDDDRSPFDEARGRNQPRQKHPSMASLPLAASTSQTAIATLIVRLPYGRESIQVELPDETHVVEPVFVGALEDDSAAIRGALEHPIGSEPLGSLVPKGSRVGVAVCDVTRPFPARRVLPVLLDHLEGSEVTLFVATGTHRSCTEPELRQMLGDEVLSRCGVVQHDAFDVGRHMSIGHLASTRTPVLVEREFVAQDVRITTGFIEPHFFAGFSGGPKMVTPGLAGIETVLDLHSATRIGSDKARWGIIENNPVHDAVREGAGMARVNFNLDVTINRDRFITGVFAGHLFASHAVGCRFVRETAMARAPRQYDVVVTSNSGYPLDQNLYQSVKGMSAAAQIVRSGGTIVIATECSDGLPDHGQYKNLLKQALGPDDFLRQLAEPGFSVHDQWQVQVQAQIQRQAHVYVRADGLSDRQLRDAWFEPIRDITGLVENLGGTVAVIPEGPQTIPYVASS